MDKRLLYALLCVGCFFGAALLPGTLGMAMLVGMFVSFCLCIWHFLLAKQEAMASSQPLMMPSAAEIAAMKEAAAAKAAMDASAVQTSAAPVAPAPEAQSAKIDTKPEVIKPLTGKAVFDLGDEPPQK
jgi:hypothetical protein